VCAWKTRDFALVDWQERAVEAWEAGDRGRPYHGTLEIFTGGGKTLIALECAQRASMEADGIRLAIVVPTEALAHQWIDAALTYTDIPRAQIGLLGAGGVARLGDHTVLVCVLNTAARRLPEMARNVGDDLMLIVDECHRAGAPTFSKVLETSARFRLGLSATPDREELDENGDVLEFDEQLVGRAIGDVVYRFGLREARNAGWLPDFEVHHHGVQLHASERNEYDRLSRQVDDLIDRLADHGADASRARSLVGRADELGSTAKAYVAATAKRKDMLYRAAERERVTVAVVHDVLRRRPEARVLLFHERVDEAARLRNRLIHSDVLRVGLEHSRLAPRERRAALDGFRSGELQVLVSVKSLVEGIDVPSADVGVSVASSSSVRQRVQSLGRVLRRSFDGAKKTAEMHVLYVSDSVDELIYAKEDWSDLIGESANHYWWWTIDPDDKPERRDGPPHSPRPTEEQEWERLGRVAPAAPTPWLGSVPDREYSVDTRGTVRTRSGVVVANPQGVAALVELVRGRLGGRFYVTPAHRLVVTREAGPEGQWIVVGRLGQPLTTLSPADAGAENVDSSQLRVGDPYPGGRDAANGELSILQKRGGVIERRLGGGIKEFALTTNADPAKVQNAERLLRSWRQASSTGLKVSVNSEWHAWYMDNGEAKFLADVPGGFAWPSDDERGM
jgi:superfamily II DNA or RNA helicase